MNHVAEIKQLRLRIRKLETENAVLSSENELLRSKIGPATWRIDGRKAEEFVQNLIGGTIQKASARFDLILRDGTTFEIKYSNLNRATPTQKTRRWNWPHILGANRLKKFDRLLLLAPHDPQYQTDFDDPDSRFVIFDIPFSDIPQLVEPSGTIWTGTHPFKFSRKAHRKLISEYQISREQLIERYASKD